MVIWRAALVLWMKMMSIEEIERRAEEMEMMEQGRGGVSGFGVFCRPKSRERRKKTESSKKGGFLQFTCLAHEAGWAEFRFYFFIFFFFFG